MVEEPGVVRFSWNEAPAAQSYILRVTPQGQGATEYPTDQTQHLLIQQKLGLAYTWQLATVCGTADTSPFTSPQTYKFDQDPTEDLEPAYTSDPEQSFEAEDPIEQDPDLMQPAGEQEPTPPDEFDVLGDLFSEPFTVLVTNPADTSQPATPISVLPRNASNEQLQEAIKSKKPTCAGITASYSCGTHDAAPQYSGSIISVAAGDDIAMNSLVLSVVNIDGSGNGQGLIKIPMMNNVKLGVTLSGIKVAEGGCIVAGRAELSGIDASILTAQQREQLAKAYAAFNKATDYGIANAGQIAEDINKTMAAIKSLSDKLNEKKRNTQAILAATDAENLTEALTACNDIDADSRALQDSLTSLICKVKAGTLKADIKKLEKAQEENKAFMDKLGPALAECQNKSFVPWDEKPCKGPCFEIEFYTIDSTTCNSKLKIIFGQKLQPCDKISQLFNESIVKAYSSPIANTLEMQMYFDEYPKLCLNQRLTIIKAYASFGLGGLVPSSSEKIIVEALKTTPDKDITVVLSKVALMLKDIYKGVDGDFFTSLKATLSTMYFKIKDKNKILSLAKSNVDVSKTLFIGYNNGTYNDLSVTYSGDKVMFTISSLEAEDVEPMTGAPLYGEKVQKIIGPLSPFDERVNIFVFNNTEGVFGNLPKNKVFPVPAYLLAWYAEKDLANKKKEAAELTADVASMFFGIGELNGAWKLAKAAKTVRNIGKVSLALAEVIPPASRLFLKATGLRSKLVSKYGQKASTMLGYYDLAVTSMDVATGIDAAYSFCKLFKELKITKTSVDDPKMHDFAAQEARMEKACEEQDFCFVAGTLVLTDVGNERIETIKKGAKIWAKNTETGQSGFKTVEKIIERSTNKLVRIIVGADTIFATPNHPFYTNHGWLDAQELTENNLLISKTEQQKINSIISIDTTATVYNFEVADYHTYYVGKNELLVHNGVCFEGVTRPFKVKRTHAAGNKQIIVNGQEWHLPKGNSIDDIPETDAVGDLLQSEVDKAAAKWSDNELTPNERNAISQGFAENEAWRANLLKAQAKGRYVQIQVGDFLKSRKDLNLKFMSTGMDIPSKNGINYEILSGTESNMDTHAKRMSGIIFRMLTF